MPMRIGFPIGQAGQLVALGDAVPIVWGNDGDQIDYSERRGRFNTIEIQFSLAPDISWWKGLEIFAPTGEMVASLELHDNTRGPISFVLQPTRQNLQGHWIRLLKAKAFGAHTPMYDLEPLTGKIGKVLRFHWVKD